VHRDRVLVTISDDHGVPMSLVEKAVAAKETDLREARRGRGEDHDQYWCVFDVDSHPRVSEAIALADRHGIEVAVSNPCIELWFLLHFADQAAHIDRRSAQRRCRDELGCEKDLNCKALLRLEERHDDAAARAQALDAKHLGDGSPRGANPSSSLWRLIDAVRSS
jgi:hypothetical protein